MRPATRVYSYYVTGPYYKGKPVRGPLVLDQASIQHVVQAAAHSQGIKPLLAHLAGGPAPLTDILVPLPIEDLAHPSRKKKKSP